MQNPTPQSPPPGPPATTTSGMDRKTASTLSYLATWVTGIIFLYVVKSNDPDVRFNAAQSIVFFGGLTVLRILFGIFTAISGIGFVFGLLNWLVSLVLLVGWIYCLYKAWTSDGARVEIPVLGQLVRPYSEQLAR